MKRDLVSEVMTKTGMTLEQVFSNALDDLGEVVEEIRAYRWNADEDLHPDVLDYCAVVLASSQTPPERVEYVT